MLVKNPIYNATCVANISIHLEQGPIARTPLPRSFQKFAPSKMKINSGSYVHNLRISMPRSRSIPRPRRPNRRHIARSIPGPILRPLSAGVACRCSTASNARMIGVADQLFVFVSFFIPEVEDACEVFGGSVGAGGAGGHGFIRVGNRNGGLEILGVCLGLNYIRFTGGTFIVVWRGKWQILVTHHERTLMKCQVLRWHSVTGDQNKM